MSNKKLNTYMNLCTEAYELSKPKPETLEYEFYKAYVLEAKGKVLEPMCGTGGFLLPFLAEGLEVEGFDASEHMLAKLFKKAEAQNLKPNVWHSFNEDLESKAQYNLIYIPAGSFCLITETDKIKKSLQIFYESLSNEGILLFALDTSAAVPELNKWHESEWIKQDNRIICLNRFSTLNDNICKVICKYELIDGAQVINSEEEEINMRIYDNPDTLTETLRGVGFRHIRFVKAFNKNEMADFNDETVIVECKK